MWISSPIPTPCPPPKKKKKLISVTRITAFFKDFVRGYKVTSPFPKYRGQGLQLAGLLLAEGGGGVTMELWWSSFSPRPRRPRSPRALPKGSHGIMLAMLEAESKQQAERLLWPGAALSIREASWASSCRC